MPPGTPQLLGLGLNYCIKPTTTEEMTDAIFTRLTKDIRQMYALKGVEDNDDGNYIPSLYLKLTYKFKKAPSHIKKAIVSFKDGILRKQLELQKRHQKKPKRNLTPLQWKLLQKLKNNDTFIIVHGAKTWDPVF